MGDPEAEPAAPAPQVAHLRLLGLLIERKTDVLAAASFLLSAIAIGSAVIATVRGPIVDLVPPEQIAILRHEYPQGLAVVRLSTRMAYINRARPEFSDAVRQERIEFTVGGVRYRQLWQSFVSYKPTESDPLGLTVLQDAQPEAIAGGGAVVHETYFAPRTRWGEGESPNHDFLGWAPFLEALKAMRALDFDIVAVTYSGRELRASCSVNLDGLEPALRNKGWSAPSCAEPRAQ